jgi:signal peptidase II
LSFFSFKSKLALVLIPAVISLALDLLTKAYVVANFDLLTVKPVTGFFNLVLAYNTGAAFSLLSGDGPAQGYKMAGLALLSMIPLIWFYRLAAPKDKGTLISLGLVMGGAFGNIHDRLRYQAVVDFLDFHWGPKHWPAFNVADITVCVGLGLLVIFTILNVEHKPKTVQTKSKRVARISRKKS